MTRSIPLALAVALCACNHDNGTATTPDLATAPDLAPAPPTVNRIDTGAIPAMTQVTLAGLVLTGIANGQGHSPVDMKCLYDAYVQDPAGAPPSGIRLLARGGACTPMGAICKCPLPPQSATVLDQLTPPNNDLGTLVTVSGTVEVLTVNGATQHNIDVNMITVTGSGGAITPFLAADANTIMTFAAGGSGYAQYESMLVTIKPTAPSQISALDASKGFTFAGAAFSGDYNYVYRNQGAFPPAQGTFTSITGVAQPGYGIAPRTMADFVQ
jgi:hypothetical protein